MVFKLLRTSLLLLLLYPFVAHDAFADSSSPYPSGSPTPEEVAEPFNISEYANEMRQLCLDGCDAEAMGCFNLLKAYLDDCAKYGDFYFPNPDVFNFFCFDMGVAGAAACNLRYKECKEGC